MLAFFKQIAINLVKEYDTIVKIDASILIFEMIYAIIYIRLVYITIPSNKEAINMEVNYRRLWHQCVEKDISKHQLMEMAEVSPSTLTRLRRNEVVSLTVLLKFCKVLGCDIGDVVEATPIDENNQE